MDRDTALQLVNDKVKEGNIVKHILATEAVMRRLAEHFDQDADRWAMVGLLHDLDYSQTMNSPQRHTYLTAEWLESYPEIDEQMIYAIHCHAGHEPCRSQLDWALYATDPTTGLIVAATLTHPSRKLAEIQVRSILRRFKEKRFAAGASRERIAACEKIDLTLEQFFELALDGMRRISDELGL